MVHLLSILAGGEEVGRFYARPIGGIGAVPVEGRFVGDKLYIMCSAFGVGRRRTVLRRSGMARGLGIEKYDLTERRSLWSTQLDVDYTSYYRIWPLTIDGGFVVVSAMQERAGRSSYISLLDDETGELRQEIEIAQDVGPVARRTRRFAMGQAVMMNGQLVVETSKGVEIYAGPK
jgi:hypothetical protein